MSKSSISSERKKAIQLSLLSYAKQSFQTRQKEHGSSSTASVNHALSSSNNYAAPISPSPQNLIDTVLPRILSNLSTKTSNNSNENINNNYNENRTNVVIDLGVGDGRWLTSAYSYLQQQCHNRDSLQNNNLYLGYDIDEERLEKAQKAIDSLLLLSSNQQDKKEVGKKEKSNIFLYKKDAFFIVQNLDKIISEHTRDIMMNCKSSAVSQSREYIHKSFTSKKDTIELGITNDTANNNVLIIIYLFREAMLKISQILRHQGYVSMSIKEKQSPTTKATTRTTLDSIENPNLLFFINIISIGFTLPHFTPFETCVDMIGVSNCNSSLKVYWYKLYKERNET